MDDTRLSPPDAARRRYAARQGFIMMAFGLAVAGAAAALRHVEEPSLRWLLAAVPVGVLVLWGWQYYRAVRDDDEMMRAFYYRTAAISGVLVLLGGTMWGLLEKLLGIPPLWTFLLLPIFAVVHGVIGFAESRRW